MAINGSSTKQGRPACADRPTQPVSLMSAVATATENSRGRKTLATHRSVAPRSKARMSWGFWLAPPRFGKIAVERGGCRPPDRVPTCDPLGRQVKQRNHVEAGDQNAI